MFRGVGRIWLRIFFALTFTLGLQLPLASGAGADSTPDYFCDYHAALCTDTVAHESAQGYYNGHDEPSLLFYSSVAGSGNSNSYTLVLPKDPPARVKQDGTGATDNFQLHPAFWLGMAMCDTQSYPEYTSTCTPDSDANIFDNANPAAPDWIGHHPGAAFMEMQFYPPGWEPWPAGNSCDPVQWCAALNIDSLGQSGQTGAANNSACLNTVGEETVNFAFITKSGVAHAPANPVDATTLTFTPVKATDLFMNSGDTISVTMQDTPDGFQVLLDDVTTGQTGSMTASTANDFGQVVYDPTATTCTATPYAFHPMYATSSVHTRVPWAAHTYNVAFSDEIGHFEYCATSTGVGGDCTSTGTGAPVDADDTYCFTPPIMPANSVQIGGCMGIPTDSTDPPFDNDWNGVPYGLNWPGTLANATQDHMLHATPIRFTSPKFLGTQSYSQVAFETDLPGIESYGVTTPCNTETGANCTDPPPGAAFYPMYTTSTGSSGCVWQFGGAKIPGTTQTFGGSSTTEYGSLVHVLYQAGTGSTTVLEDFRRTLNSNPC
jgi:hypothetical protein